MCGGATQVDRDVIEGSHGAGTIVLSPAVTEVKDLQPSTVYAHCLMIHNRQSKPQRFELSNVDLVGSANPDQQQEFLDPPSVLGTWIRTAVDAITLQPGERARIPYSITTPASLPGGSLSAAIKVVQVDEVGPVQGGAKVVPAVLERIYLTLPGGVSKPLVISDERAPKLLQRRKRQLTYTARFNVRNDGTITDVYTVDLNVEGLGRRVGSVHRAPATILPGGAGRVDLVWSEVPWIGWFRPVALVRSRAGTVEVVFPHVWVLPATPYVAALMVAALLPVLFVLVSWRRRRQEWLAYLDDELLDEEADSYDEDHFEQYGPLH